jgi:prolipoprotein diacylglyceryltransferase
MIPYHPTPKISIGGFSTTPESIAMNISFIIFIIFVYLMLKKSRWKNLLDKKQFARLIIILIFSSLAGGRLWYYAERWSGYETLIALFDLSKGGLVSIGMLMGGVVGILIFVLFFLKTPQHTTKHLQLARLTDILSPATALWIFLYRLFGCSIYGICTVGTKTSVSWALYWVKEGVSRHPLTFYLALSALIIFTILLAFFSYEKTADSRFGKRFDGEPALWFGILYFFNRFWLEFFRTNRADYFGLHTVQWVCVVVFVLLLARLIQMYLKLKKYNVKSYKEWLLVANKILK